MKSRGREEHSRYILAVCKDPPVTGVCPDGEKRRELEGSKWVWSLSVWLYLTPTPRSTGLANPCNIS